VTAILSYPWPGNVRELKNVLESTAITRPGPWVEADDLPEALRGGVAEESDAAPVGATLDDFERDLIRRTLLRHAGNRTYAAKSLGIGLRTLQRKIQRYGLRLRGTRGRPATGSEVGGDSEPGRLERRQPAGLHPETARAPRRPEGRGARRGRPDRPPAPRARGAAPRRSRCAIRRCSRP